jgi:hypothetical protein
MCSLINQDHEMEKFGDLLNKKWAAITIWVVVMYVTAFLWNVMDDDSWFAFPTYVISALAWIGSCLNVAGLFLEWTGSGIRLKLKQATPADT